MNELAKTDLQIEALSNWLHSHADRGHFDKFEITPGRGCGDSVFEVEFTEYGISAQFRVKMDEEEPGLSWLSLQELEVNVYEDNFESCLLDTGPFWVRVLDFPFLKR